MHHCWIHGERIWRSLKDHLSTIGELSSTPIVAFGYPFPPSFCHRQSLHSATWPRRKSLQGQRRLYLGEYPAQLKRRGSRWRPHSRRSTENAGRMWLISESIMSHCTSNLRDGTEKQRSERSNEIKHLIGGILQRVKTNREQKNNFFEIESKGNRWKLELSQEKNTFTARKTLIWKKNGKNLWEKTFETKRNIAGVTEKEK